MKRRRLSVQLSEQQQLLVALLLVLLVAVSVLYCLGLASTVILQNWKDSPLPLDENGLLDLDETAPFGSLLAPTPQNTQIP